MSEIKTLYGNPLVDTIARNSIGDLSELTTSAKGNLVAAINEAAQSGGSGTPEVDVETDVAQTLPWEQGTINSNGAPGSAMSTRVRNSDFVEIESGYTELRFEIISGYRYCVFFYDENEAVISGTPHYDTWMTESWTLTGPFTYAYYKVLLAKTDNGAINPTTGPANIKIIVTQKVPMDLSKIGEVMDVVEAQTSDEALTLTLENYDFGWRWGAIDDTSGGDITSQYKSVNRTDFIRVGEGTVVEYDGSSTYGIAVHCYDEDKAFIGNSGNDYVRGYSVPQDGYIRIQLRAGATDSATIEQDKAAVTVLRKLPAGFIKDLVENGGLPSYYDAPIKTAITAAKADMITAGMTGDSFIFFSDVHWPNNTGRTYKVVDRIMQEIPTLQNVFNCGDTINAASDADESIPAFMKTHLPKHGTLYNLIGNHDIYVSDARLYAELLKHFEYKVITGGFGYYYFDNNATKTRYICLNTKGQGSDLGTAQLAWLNATLDSMPDGYNALVFAHILYNFASDWHDAAITAHGTQIANACDTFNTNNANKKVFAIFGGHVHVDLDFTTPGGIPIVLIDNNGTNTWGPNTATAGTITEIVLDVVTVDYTNKTIKCERIGRGTSRSFTAQA